MVDGRAEITAQAEHVPSRAKTSAMAVTRRTGITFRDLLFSRRLQRLSFRRHILFRTNSQFPGEKDFALQQLIARCVNGRAASCSHRARSHLWNRYRLLPRPPGYRYVPIQCEHVQPIHAQGVRRLPRRPAARFLVQVHFGRCCAHARRHRLGCCCRERVVGAPVSEAQGRRSFSPLVRNALALMVSSMGSSVIGIVFWGVAAHLVSVESIGRASAELTAMTLLASLASLSIGSTFIRFLPVSGNRTRRFVARSYGSCVSLALILALIYVSAGFGRRFLPTGVGWRALFVVVVAFWVVFTLQDAALTGLRATKWIPVENLLFGVAKLALLPLFVLVIPGQGIFLAWSAPVFVAVALVTRYLFHTRIPEHESTSHDRSSLPAGKEIASVLGAQGATELVAIVSSLLMPLIVISRLGASANGHFYLPWTIAGSFSLLIFNVLSSFLVEAAHDPSTMRLHVDRTVRLTLLILLPGVTIGVALAPYLLRIFGATYAEHGTTLLRLLLIALPGTAVTSFFTSFLWLERRMLVLTCRQIANATVFLGVTLLLIGHFGLLAVGIASLATEVVQAVIFLPGAIGRYRMVNSETGWKSRDVS